MLGRSLGATLIALFATLLIGGAPPAAAVVVPPTSGALPGSGFQGGDGNQTDQAPLIDWAGLAASGRVVHSADPNANDDVFSGGNKENNPGGWSFTTQAGGSTPGGTNIRDAWASVDQVGGKTFLYLALARQSDTGTTALTFDLNRDGSFWDNGHAKKVPCRREGDILISVEPHGNDLEVIVQRWHTLTTDPNGSGCAVTGTLRDATPTANVDVQGAFNPTTITNNVLQGSLTSIGPRLFIEAAIDLGKVAAAAFGDRCLAYTSIWMHSRSSTSEDSQMQDVVWPQPFELRTCAAAGTKFVDLNANGQRDPGEPGIAGAKIFADYNNNGVHDAGEPFAISDTDGNYVIDDISRSPYTLRETTLSGSNPNRWRCSYPNAGVTSPPGATSVPNGLAPCAWTVDGSAEPYARGRDFGNYRPAHLIVRKQVSPAGDLTQFEVVHPGGTFTLGDGDQAGGDIDLAPGTYTAAEIANPDFTSSSACGVGSARASPVPGSSGTITLKSGDTGVCTFYNVRNGAPGIAIDKSGPATAIAGDRLDYTLVVTNVGTVAFAESDVAVTDPRCDAPPRRINQGDDPTPDTLEPQESWTYVCSQQTDQPTNACVPHNVVNTGHVEAGGQSDSSSMTTALTCPKPDIALTKIGPDSAPAGAMIRYVFYVYNTGDVAFAAGGNTSTTANVTVSDGRCDSDPVLADKFSSAAGDPDGSPGSFDPGDVWVFTCLSTTPRNEAGCTPSTLTNTGIAQAATGELSAVASDSWDTALTCDPPAPGPPPVEPLLPIPPVPPDLSGDESLIAGVVTPPRAGTAGVARVVRVPACVRRGSVVTLRVARAASATFFVSGRRIRGLSVRPLQSRVIVRIIRRFPPGRYRVTARVRFQRGAGTAPLRLVRTVRVCGSPRRLRRPTFTG